MSFTVRELIFRSISFPIIGVTDTRSTNTPLSINYPITPCLISFLLSIEDSLLVPFLLSFSFSLVYYTRTTDSRCHRHVRVRIEFKRLHESLYVGTLFGEKQDFSKFLQKEFYNSWDRLSRYRLTKIQKKIVVSNI